MAEGGDEDFLLPRDSDYDLEMDDLADLDDVYNTIQETSTSRPVAESSFIEHNKWHDTSYNPSDADYEGRGEAFARIREIYPEFGKDHPEFQARMHDGQIQVAADDKSKWRNFRNKKGEVTGNLPKVILENLGPTRAELLMRDEVPKALQDIDRVEDERAHERIELVERRDSSGS